MMKIRICTYFVLILLPLLAISCSKTNSKVDKIELTDLLISINDMPDHWISFRSGPGFEPERSSDTLGIDFYSDLFPESLTVSEEVYRHDSLARAKNDFEYALREYSSNNVPSEWTFRSEIADESYFSCLYYPNISFPVCQWLARYDRLIIQFSAWLIPDCMTLQEMEGIVRIIDKEVGELLAEK